MRLIDADALKKHYSWWGDYPEEAPERAEEKKIFDTIIDLQPTVETRRGKWIDDNCSECGQYVYRGDMRNYCPNCGARMDK